MKPMALQKLDAVPVSSSGTSQVFLFSQTLSSAKAPAASSLPDFLSSAISDELQDVFLNAFPGVLTGQLFVDAALKQMGAFGFSILMIRPDSRVSVVGAGAAMDSFLMNAGVLLEELTQPLHAVWGMINPQTLGCMVANIDLSVCRNFGRNFQDKLSEFQKETASIGIAVYPQAGYTRNDAVANALKALAHAALVGPGSIVVLDAVSLNISGDNLYQAGNLQGAAQEYQKALVLDPFNVNVRNSLGVCYGMMEMYDAAESEFDAALLIEPGEVMSLYNQAVICMLTGQNETALNFIEKAVAVDDGIFELVLLTGKLYLETGNPEKARSFLEKAVSIRPKSGTALRTLGACLSDLNLFREAVAVYSRAVKSNPNDAESFSMLGLLYDRIGENPEIARLFCQQSVAIAPENDIYRERLNRLAQKTLKVAFSPP
jgi:tetratricopeptide (TPR) repeat protein